MNGMLHISYMYMYPDYVHCIWFYSMYMYVYMYMMKEIEHELFYINKRLTQTRCAMRKM